MNFYKGRLKISVKVSTGGNKNDRGFYQLIRDLNKAFASENDELNIAFDENYNDGVRNEIVNFDQTMQSIMAESEYKKAILNYYVKTNNEIKDFDAFKKKIEDKILNTKMEAIVLEKAKVSHHSLWPKGGIEIFDETFERANNVIPYLYRGIVNDKDMEVLKNAYINAKIPKIKISEKRLTKDELLVKHASALKNKSLIDEVERAFNLKSEKCIQGVNYLFKEENQFIRREQYDAIAEAMYATGRIDKPLYYLVNIDTYANNIDAFITYLKTRIRMANNSLYFFEFCRLTEPNNDPFSNNMFLASEKIYSFLESLKTNQFFNIFGLSMDENSIRDFDCLNEKELINKFSLVVFGNKLNVEAQEEYAKQKLKNIKQEDLIPNMVDIIKCQGGENEGLTSSEIDDYIYGLLQDKYARIYKPVYKDITNEMINGNVTEKLMKMIGLENLKQAVSELKNRVRFKEIKENLLPVTRALGKFAYVERNNWILTGSPGTGKSTAAEILEKVMYQEKIIKKDILVKYTPSYNNDEDDDYLQSIFGMNIGSTIRDSFAQAMGGVLVVDEIGHLSSQDKSLLLQLMEDNKKSVSVILCGYEKEARELLNYNPGFRSRFTHIIHMEDYTADQLFEILEMNLKGKNFYLNDSAKKDIQAVISDARAVANFGQARFIESLSDKLIAIHSSSKLNAIEEMIENNQEADIKTDDIYEINSEDISKLSLDDMLGDEYTNVKKLGDPKVQLDRLIGCEGIKNAIREYLAKVQVDMIKIKKKLIKKSELNMNMVFYGAPGTAKTTIARLVARILYNNGIVTSPDIVEVGASDLVAAYVGQTGIKTSKVFQKARGKVLFIDEAYTLANSAAGGFNQEAIDTIIREMENHRSDTMVIFAGYKKQMQDFINCNPGFKSRISKYIDFPNYSRDELLKIFLKLASDIGYVLDKKDKNKILDTIGDYLETRMQDYNFGNGRECRTILEDAINRQSQRLIAMKDIMKREKELMVLKLSDFKFDTNDFKFESKQNIGFAA